MDKKLFENQKDVLDGVKDAEKVHQRWINRKCDWSKPEDRAFLESQERAVEGKHHGLCKCCKLYQTTWYNRGLCISCFMVNNGKWEIGVGWNGMAGESLKVAREKRGISRASLGRLTGYSKAWIQRVEAGAKLNMRFSDRCRKVLAGQPPEWLVE